MNEALSRLLREEDTVLFIGSGVSAWSGLLSWGELLKKIADYLDSLGKDTAAMRRDIGADPVKAADFAISPDRLSEAALGRFLRDECQFGTAQPHAIHHKIVTLSPRCFVTTNYDHLLEDALRAEYRSRSQLVVKNNQPIEIAEIIGARAKDYVYKLHGDIDDSASLILARSQYRRLLENGERKSALDALRTLLVTRPVVFIGFGLRDLDFLLVQDELQNLWKGVPREHYAILPDASPNDSADWLRNYGIRVVSYATVQRPEGGRDHAALLPLLDELRQPPAPPTAALPPTASFDTPATRLALLRYANGLADSPAVSPEIPLRVHAARHTRADAYRHDHSPLQKFLDEGPARAVLIGLPGAGKTYALKQAAARAAQHLRAADQADTFDPATVVVPLLADFKLYEGSIQQLLERTLPGSLSLSGLASTFRLLILLDSFNEMPREQWERETHEADLAAFLQQFPTARILISSRTEEGLSKLNLSIYTIDEIEASFLQEELERRGLDLSGRFKSEMFGLLSKPFFFQLVARNKVALPAEPRPRDIYESYFTALDERFMHRFGVAFDVARALCSAAYEAINSGQEAMPVATIAQALRRNMQGANVSAATPEEVIAWLVGEDVLLTYSGRRVAFFHQSVTEYLAATELARRYVENPTVLLQKLAFTRWDQALFLTLSLLSKSYATRFINQVITVDFDLATRATKYLENGRDAVVTKLLKFLLKEDTTNSQEYYFFENLPFNTIHDKYLRKLAESENHWAYTQSYIGLIHIYGAILKDEIIDLLFANADDSDFCFDLGMELANSVTSTETISLIERLENEYLQYIQRDNEEELFEVSSAIGAMLSSISLNDLREILLDPNRQAKSLPIRASVLQQRIELYIEDEEGPMQPIISIALEMIERGLINGALVISQNNWQKVDAINFQAAHLVGLVSLIARGDGFVALRALADVCILRPDLISSGKDAAKSLAGMEYACAITATDCSQQVLVLNLLEQALTMTQEQRTNIRFELLAGIKLDWSNSENLFFQLIQLDDKDFVEDFLSNSYMSRPEKLNLTPIDLWLNWLAEFFKSNTTNDRMPFWFAKKLFTNNENCHKELLIEFNHVNSPYRELLMSVLADIGCTTDDFSDETQSFLLGRLSSYQRKHYGHTLLGQTATEAFVQERLLPLYTISGAVVRSNLTTILEEAGRRHRRRYLLPTA